MAKTKAHDPKYCVIHRGLSSGYKRKMLHSVSDAIAHAEGIFRNYGIDEGTELLVVQVKKVVRRPIDLEIVGPEEIPF